jgi:hypothetical protein
MEAIMETEMWKTIPDYNKYEASNRGKIRNKETMHVMTLHINKGGYLITGIKNDAGKQKTVLVHRIIASVFIDNPYNYPTVNHKDHDPTNNHVDNLEYASYSQQNYHSRACPPGKKKLVGARSVQRIDLKTGEILQTYESVIDAGRWVKAQRLSKALTPHINIYLVCREKKDCSFGFRWSFKPHERIDEENWKPLPPSIVDGTEGFFVSDKGRLKNKAGRITTGYQMGEGSTVGVSVGPKYYTLSRLIAHVFLENPNNYAYVIHLGEHDNNCVENLKWATGIERYKNAKERRLKGQIYIEELS